MHGQLLELSDTVEMTALELLKNYQPVDLHAFRVSIRRIRSILKQMDSPRARRYRKVWGGFATVTNQARDWDVFMIWASRELEPDEFERFSQMTRERLASSHEAVFEVLRSAHWQRHFREWGQLLTRNRDIPANETVQSISLELALARARATLSRALSTGDDRSWHKFRIAVKDVRYLADALPDESPTLIESCKKLQTVLGKWHDTVVQLSLLDELEGAALNERLPAAIRTRQERLLSQIRDLLTDDPYFFPEPAQSP